jgi:hypothetical protein
MRTRAAAAMRAGAAAQARSSGNVSATPRQARTSAPMSCVYSNDAAAHSTIALRTAPASRTGIRALPDAPTMHVSRTARSPSRALQEIRPALGGWPRWTSTARWPPATAPSASVTWPRIPAWTTRAAMGARAPEWVAVGYRMGPADREPLRGRPMSRLWAPKPGRSTPRIARPLLPRVGARAERLADVRTTATAAAAMVVTSVWGGAVSAARPTASASARFEPSVGFRGCLHPRLLGGTRVTTQMDVSCAAACGAATSSKAVLAARAEEARGRVTQAGAVPPNG